MAAYEQGISMPYPSVNAGVIQPDVFGVAINWFVNRTPLISRLPKAPGGSDSFLVTNDNYRPRTLALSAGYTTGSSTTLTFADATSIDVGDILTVGSEAFIVTAAHATTPTVTGAYAGTTGANHSSGDTVTVITNARTGGEVDLNAVTKTLATVEQYHQTVQHAYQVSGSLQADTNFVSGEGMPLPLAQMKAMRMCMDDFEVACYNGYGVKRTASNRPSMKGLSSLISTNKVTSPTNASAYKPSDLVRDTFEACLEGGGKPTFFLCSTDFTTGFAIWGHHLMRLNVGENVFGTPIDSFESSFLPGAVVVPAPLLPKGTVIALCDPEVRIRLKRSLFDKPRGSRGDAFEGDFIMEGAIELENEAHHAYVTGITGFAAST